MAYKTTDLKLGDTVRDTITEFTGVVIAEHKYLNGCCRLSIQPKELKDGKPIEALTFDAEQLELVTRATERTVVPAGGPMDAPSRHSSRAR